MWWFREDIARPAIEDALGVLFKGRGAKVSILLWPAIFFPFALDQAFFNR